MREKEIVVGAIGYGITRTLVESLLRAAQIAQTVPRGPVYICLDAGLQEAALDDDFVFPDYARFMPAEPSRPAAASISKAARRMRGSLSRSGSERAC